MAMVVKNNLGANSTLNRLNQNNGKLAKSLKKVSTGTRITDAGDDGSGYSISERMRVRIRGLEQCSRNVNNGYDMLNIAGKAVEEQVNIMGKMREIALKASDDTYSQEDRDILSGEADQLFDQLEMIGRETHYNGIRLLDRATPHTTVSSRMVTKLAPFDPKTRATHNDTSKLGNLFPTSPSRNPNTWASETGAGYYLNTTQVSASTGNDKSVDLNFANDVKSTTVYPDDFNLQGFSVLCDGCGQFISIVFNADASIGESERQDAPSGSAYQNSCQYVIGIKNCRNVTDIENAVYDGIVTANQKQRLANNTKNRVDTANHTADETLMRGHDTYVTRQNGVVTLRQNASNMAVIYEGTKGVSSFEEEEVSVLDDRNPWEDMYIQSDTKATQNTQIRLWNTTVDALFPAENTSFKLEPEPHEYPTFFDTSEYPDPDEYPELYEGYVGTPLEKQQQLWRDTEWMLPRAGAYQTGECLRTREGANYFLYDLDQALKYALGVGTSIGAQMQRMQVADANITVNHENTMASESTIRDADMAKEMTEYTKNNVLLQAAQSMLAQANQNSSSVLSLLQ